VEDLADKTRNLVLSASKAFLKKELRKGEE
jgi:hypothetical protein